MTGRPAVPPGLASWCVANGWDAARVEPLSGGAVSTVVRLTRVPRESVVAKWTADPPDGLFVSEADGLRQLAASGTVSVPEVVAVGADHLVVEDLGPGDLGSVGWERLGRDVAALHAMRSERFGADHDNYLGSLPQRNDWTVDGHEFFARHRLLRYGDEPLAAAAFTAQDRRRLDRLAHRLPQLVPAQPAALLHGDLWSGNVVGARRTSVIDPAVYFGWPEAELSMLWCSGNVDHRFFDAYLELHPLEPGWRERMPVLHLREQLSVLAHFGDRHGVLERIRDVLRRFAD